MYQVERKMANGGWYEVMLSPFKTLQEVDEYLKKYINFYPEEDKTYRVTNNSK